MLTFPPKEENADVEIAMNQSELKAKCQTRGNIQQCQERKTSRANGGKTGRAKGGENGRNPRLVSVSFLID